MKINFRARVPPTVPQNGLLVSMPRVGDQNLQGTSRPGVMDQITVHTHALSEETLASGRCGQAWATLGSPGLGEPRAGSKTPISSGKRGRVDCKSGQTSNRVGLRSVTCADTPRRGVCQ